MAKPFLRILDTDFNLHGEIDDYESLQFTRRFFRPGEFEIHIALSKQHTGELMKDRVIYINNEPNKAGYIQYRGIEEENGIETLVVKGPTLGGVLDRRITVTDSYDRVSGAAETVLKHYVNRHIVDGLYPGRAIPFVASAPDLLRGKSTPWQSRYENLLDVAQQIAEWCDIGWGVNLDFAARKWVFDVIEGRNVSASQSALPPVIFAHEFDNVESESFIDSDANYKNVGYAGGPGEDEDRLIQVVGEATGFDRREVFLDASQAEDAAELVTLGQQQLAQQKQILTFDGKVLDTQTFRYGVDWDLGDIVTLRNKRWGVTMDPRVTEVKEIYEKTSSLEVKFGTDIPDITREMKALKNKVKRSG
ncbi:siphovirus ReqiPepy6 Gp37-like family protein [Cohnella lubricantis]|uniref:Siphovirus ReqiPepy6 Gp37-like family protein n=1 Tax=Cohnella lubricantis TaxID=2163172 RepID=A0A841TDX1_9BACL|nr:siphovirus ReqiPepy6 Gp37-like family protein [Cohnella lubricantis]MBB6677528.1 siphovirus ReqiPepy6 Gp37-like family protein [Cohnella lubricantis]MBP2116586.1 hypothetical protein [Cohnella lubricantis]